MKTLYTGALAGLLAALPMSLIMGLIYRLLPGWQQYPLPPREITLEMARRAGVEDEIDQEPATTLATSAGHFGYAALTGAVYAATLDRLRLPTLIKGMVFGVALWAVSYMGWIPALDILRPATRQPRQRTIMMIIAHLVFGSAVAGITDRKE